jgi:nicotinate dehydrogenase subunit A
VSAIKARAQKSSPQKQKSALSAEWGDNMAKSKTLSVNGKRVSIRYDDPDMPLLYVVRDNLGLHGPRFGCGLGQCGSCMVHIDGAAVQSCVTPLSAISGKQKIVTLEGLGTPAKPHPVQKAFIDEQAAQCGYCINGMVMQSAALLAKNKKPSEADIKNALANNLCRCGTHARIVRAVKRAAAQA